MHRTQVRDRIHAGEERDLRVRPTEHPFSCGGDGSISIPSTILTETNDWKQQKDVETTFVTFILNRWPIIFETVLSRSGKESLFGGQQMFLVGSEGISLSIWGRKENKGEKVRRVVINLFIISNAWSSSKIKRSIHFGQKRKQRSPDLNTKQYSVL